MEHAFHLTPIGWVRLEYQHEVAYRLNYCDGEDPGASSSLFSCEVFRQLDDYFAGKLKDFKVECCLEGTDFQKRVWQALLQIPYGQTLTYGAIAGMAGSPNACRGAGQAIHRNPLAIIYPCHRVIGADGSLTGYGGGLEKKKWLLDLEGWQAT
jgi:methylated-DNA-[protein]-cysteine S-methyltransferase